MLHAPTETWYEILLSAWYAFMKTVRLDYPLGLLCRVFGVSRSGFMRRWIARHRNAPRTTNSKHAYPIAPNLLEQTFAPTVPNQAWVSEITCVATDEGWLYLVGIKDVFTCEMVGYALGARMTQELTAQALWRQYATSAQRQA